MKKLQRDRSGNHQVQRAQWWTQRLREKVARSALAFLERREQRLAWWKRTFRIPQVSQSWLFSQAGSLGSAFLSLLGLVGRGLKSKLSRSRASRLSGSNRYVRADAVQLVYESLESRQLMAGLAVSTRSGLQHLVVHGTTLLRLGSFIDGWAVPVWREIRW